MPSTDVFCLITKKEVHKQFRASMSWIPVIWYHTQGLTWIRLSADRYSAWTRQKTTLFSGHYLRNRSTLDMVFWVISVYFNIRNTLPKSPGTPVYVAFCVCVCVYTHTHTYIHICRVFTILSITLHIIYVCNIQHQSINFWATLKACGLIIISLVSSQNTGLSTALWTISAVNCLENLCAPCLICCTFCLEFHI